MAINLFQSIIECIIISHFLIKQNSNTWQYSTHFYYTFRIYLSLNIFNISKFFCKQRNDKLIFRTIIHEELNFSKQYFHNVCIIQVKWKYRIRKIILDYILPYPFRFSSVWNTAILCLHVLFLRIQYYNYQVVSFDGS